MDEIGLIVTDIDDQGFVKFTTVGGIDKRILVSKTVSIGSNRVPGVIGAKPIHLQKNSERSNVIPLDDLYIDIGADTKNEAEQLIEIGDYVAFNTIYEELNIIPELISSYTAREYAFPEFMAIRKFNKKGQLYDFKHYETAIKKNQLVLFGQFPWDIDKKLLLFNKVNEKYPYIEWKINKNGELAQENFDSSDSLICILGQLNFDKYKNNEFKIFEYDLSNKNLISYKTQLNTEIYSKTIEIS